MKRRKICVHSHHDKPALIVADEAPTVICRRRRSTWKTVLTLTGAAAGAVAAANAVIAMRAPLVRDQLGGVFNRFPSRHGDLAYTVSGSGSPLLLLHALYAGNSMAEWSRNFALLSRHHTVYALDFLGWGLSDKPSYGCTSDDLVELVHEFVENVIGQPAAVVASGQSCALALNAAHQAPQWFSNFVLVCPVPATQASELAYLQHELAHRILRLPIVGDALYNLSVSRHNLENFASRHLYFDKTNVDEQLITRYYAGAHQRGAQAAMASLLSGQLDVDWREAWSRLQAPALLVWGRNALIGGLETAPEWLALKPDAALEVIDEAMLLPHAEHPQTFNDLVLSWLTR